jgi:hypothetical protein
LILLSLLSAWCLGTDLVTADPLERSNEQQAAQCKLTILAGSNGRVQQASMSCTGAVKPTVGLNATYLKSFRDQFTGVDLGASCISKATEDTPCLITICSGSIALRDSSVSMVQGVPLKGLMCVAHSSRLEVYNSRFTNNQVRPFLIGDQARVVLHHSHVSNNAVGRYANGGGMLVEGNAIVTLRCGSRMEGNLVGLDGGGVAAFDTARVTITGNSKVHGNTAGAGGGGVYVYDNARVEVAGGSSISNNKAAWGGGLDAEGNSTVTITGGSIVQGNMGGQGGGGLFVGGNASVEVAGGSNISKNVAGFGGGGLDAWDNVSITITGGSSVHGNRADRSGGGVEIATDAQVAIINSSVHGNRAGRFGGGVSAQATSKVTIHNSILIGNTAQNMGGGLLAMHNARVLVANGSRIHSNQALGGSGGGLEVSGAVVLTISGGCSIANDSCTEGVGGGISVGMGGEGLRFASMGRLDGYGAHVGRGKSNARAIISGSTIANIPAIVVLVAA